MVTKLAEAGAVTLGKLNCDEFAMGSANENSAVAPWALMPRPPCATLGHRPHSWRLVRRQRRGRGRAPGTCRHRHRHRRLHPPARLVLRHHRHQAHLWPRQPLRHDRVCLQPGPGRPHGPQRRRLRPAAVGHVRPRPGPRLHQSGRARRKLQRQAQRQHRRPAHRHPGRVLWRRSGARCARL